MHESCNYFQLFCYFHLENLHTFHVKYVKFVNQNFKIILKFCYPLKNILTDIHVLRANSIENTYGNENNASEKIFFLDA